MKFLLILLHFFHPEPRKIHLEGYAQGTTWMINYYAEDSVICTSQIDSIFNKIDSSLSIYKPYSLISQFNQSDSGLAVDSHFVTVIEKSIETYYATKGAFDITYRAKCRGSDQLIIKGNTIIKKQSCISIDVNGIAQGYTVDVIAEFLIQNGITNFIAEVGGEIRISGKRQPSNEKMKVEIKSPFEEKIVSLDSGAITTSSNYEKNHIIDPASGEPISNELVSVTVYAKNAITADAYDNALMVMGLKKAIRFIEKRKDLAAYFIYRNKKGEYAAKSSKRFRKLMANQ